MPTLREFITQNTFSDKKLETIRENIAKLASGRQEIHPNSLPSLLELTASDGLNRYHHHQEILKFIERHCPNKIDVEMSDEDIQQLAGIGATVFELKYFAQ